MDKLIDALEVAENQIYSPGDSLLPALQSIAAEMVNVMETWYTLLDLNLVFERYQETSGYNGSH